MPTIRKPLFNFSALQTDRALREIHHFLWIDPHINRGVLDHGWNCRDHAWIAAFLAKAAALEPLLFRGKAAFIAKRRDDSEGLVIEQATHAWMGIDSLGSFDLSIRPSALIDGDELRLPMKLVFGNRVLSGTKVGFGLVRDEASYRRALSGALTANKSAAIYLLLQGDGFDVELLRSASAWINSPLTDKLKVICKDASAAYCALALHLIEFLRDRKSTLTGLSQEQAWQVVAMQSDSAASELQELLAIQ